MKDVQTQSSFTWSWCVLSTTPHFSPPLSWWFRSDKIDFRQDLFQASEGHFDWRLYFISLTVSEIHSCYLLFVCLFRKEVYWKPWDEGNVFLVSQSQFNITPSQSVRNMQNMTVETFQSVSSFLPHDLLFFCCCCSFAFFLFFLISSLSARAVNSKKKDWVLFSPVATLNHVLWLLFISSHTSVT